MLHRIRSLRLASLLTICGLALAGPIALRLAGASPSTYPAVPVIGGKQVAPTAPTDAQVLTYSSGTGKWAPATPSSGPSVPVSIANGGTGSATKNFVDLTTTQSVAGAKTFTTSPLTIASTLASTSGTDLTLTGTGASRGVVVNANGASLIDFGVTAPGFVALYANASIGGMAGTGALSFGGMTGDTSFPTGSLSWTGATGKSFAMTAAANSTFSTTSGTLTLNAAGNITIGSTSTGVNVAAAGVTTAILGNLTMATTKTLIVGSNTLISSDKIQGTQIAGTVPAASLTAAPPGMWTSEAIGTNAVNTNFDGPFRTTSNGGTFRSINCSAGVAGLTGSTAMTVQIYNVTDSTSVCICTIGACNTAAHAPMTPCDCSSAFIAAKAYAVRLTGIGDCVTPPQNTICVVEYTP